MTIIAIVLELRLWLYASFRQIRTLDLAFLTFRISSLQRSFREFEPLRRIRRREAYRRHKFVKPRARLQAVLFDL